MQQENKQVELIYRKLLQEYNAILIALFTVSLGAMGLSYTITQNIALTILFGGVVYLFLNSYKEDKSKEIDSRIQEAT